MSDQLKISRPSPQEHDPFYVQFLSLVSETDIFDALRDQLDEVRTLVANCPPDQENAVHAPYQWSVKEVLGHCIDNERIFGYRVHRISAADPTPLLGYDQDLYIDNRDYTALALAELMEELEFLRMSHLFLLKRIAPECWDLKGTCDGKEISVRAIAFLLVGHLRHHTNILDKRLKG